MKFSVIASQTRESQTCRLGHETRAEFQYDERSQTQPIEAANHRLLEFAGRVQFYCLLKETS
jgi:glutamine cyclotransferase